MKVCIISTDYPAPSHPKYVFVEQLVNEMVKQGVDISVIAPQSITRHFLKCDPLLPENSVNVIGSHRYHVYRPKYLTLGNAPSFIQKVLQWYRYRVILKVINSQKILPDALYGHFWQNAYDVRKYSYKNGTPLFVACGEGDSALEDLVNSLSESEKERLSAAVTGVISVSSLNKRKCIEYGLSKADDIVVLPNSVNSSLFSNIKKIDRKKLGVSDDDFLIVFTGAFIHRKGSARLAEAIDKIGDKKIKVIFIGKPIPGDDAPPHCNGIVHIGPLDHDDIPSYLSVADTFCLPTLNEGCSNAIVEAIACGLPIISSNRPFNDDILDSSNAIQVNPESVDEIATAIKRLKDDTCLREKLAEGSKEKAKSLRIEFRAKKIIEFINNPINK